MFRQGDTVYFRGEPFIFHGTSSIKNNCLIYQKDKSVHFQDVFLTKHEGYYYYRVDKQFITQAALNNRMASHRLDKEW
jgi:hypothetical protein